eukprot:CAMPEP_0118815458 /NCGR_PEP_ID=MMETSP1162-20130426/4206_1 /TAXON_ID=33656 /ORGANISM="Phaeocystis Sp, Strain CCMP2710" /LENGTH=71 /DNA_ID=CAMNT_0006745427 /DNA_START=137 /DNA_END=349 /DNA_ORIENTATION=+
MAVAAHRRVERRGGEVCIDEAARVRSRCPLHLPPLILEEGRGERGLTRGIPPPPTREDADAPTTAATAAAA